MIYKVSKVRKFSAEELQETATGTALIIDDADLGYMAIIPLKDKTYKEMKLSDEALESALCGEVVNLEEAYIQETTTWMEESDSKTLAVVLGF